MTQRQRRMTNDSSQSDMERENFDPKALERGVGIEDMDQGAMEFMRDVAFEDVPTDAFASNVSTMT